MICCAPGHGSSSLHPPARTPALSVPRRLGACSASSPPATDVGAKVMWCCGARRRDQDRMLSEELERSSVDSELAVAAPSRSPTVSRASVTGLVCIAALLSALAAWLTAAEAGSLRRPLWPLSAAVGASTFLVLLVSVVGVRQVVAWRRDSNRLAVVDVQVGGLPVEAHDEQDAAGIERGETRHGVAQQTGRRQAKHANLSTGSAKQRWADMPEHLRLPEPATRACRASALAFAREAAPAAWRPNYRARTPALVPGPEHRAVTVRELHVLADHVRKNAHEWERWIPDAQGIPQRKQRLTPEEVNLYDVNVNLLAPLGAELGASYAELFARGQQRTPVVFVSHAWSHPFLQTCEVLKQHAEDRDLGYDALFWICAMVLRQHAPGEEIPDRIPDSPFFKAIKRAKMTLIVVSADKHDVGVLGRSWCALEMQVSMVEGHAGYLTDIYAHHGGKVMRLTDGLIPRDSGLAGAKALRDVEFPLHVVDRAMSFRIKDAKATEDRDKMNIMRHVRNSPRGEEVVDATVRAHYFVAALPALVVLGKAALTGGFDALRASALRRLSLSDGVGKKHVRTLLKSLPASLTELLLPQVGVGNAGEELIAEFLRDNATLTTLNLRSNEIRDEGAKHLADALKVNATLTDLNLERNRIGPEGAKHLADALRVNATLTSLHLRLNGISGAGARHLADALKVNATLTSLNLVGNYIADEGAGHLADALKVNATLTELGLDYNEIGPDGAKHLAGALRVNATLTTLSLWGNKIGDEGATRLADALKVNTTLTSLNLSWNQFGGEGARHLADALKVNATLTSLDLSFNKIADAGARHLADALKVNATLTTLWLTSNEIGPDGEDAVRKAWRHGSGLYL